jgi:hypothetical protein
MEIYSLPHVKSVLLVHSQANFGHNFCNNGQGLQMNPD